MGQKVEIEKTFLDELNKKLKDKILTRTQLKGYMMWLGYDWLSENTIVKEYGAYRYLTYTPFGKIKPTIYIDFNNLENNNIKIAGITNTFKKE